VNIVNPLNVVYLKGSETTDGSIRLIIDPSDERATLEIRQNEVWNFAELKLAQGSLLLGREASVSAASHHLVIKSPVIEEKHLVVNQDFDDTGTKSPESTIAAAKQIRVIGQSDNSVEQSLNNHSSVLAVTNESIVDKLYLKTGSVVASANIKVVLSHGIPPNDAVSFQFNIPASSFPANSEVIIDLSPGDGFNPNIQANLFVTSNNAFSLLYDTTSTFLWFALDSQQIDHEEVLTESLVLSNDLRIAFNNTGELARGNPVFT
ncbi:hypothetical protein LCGC14_2875740, partial [marine sediment metagenome]